MLQKKITTAVWCPSCSNFRFRTGEDKL